MINADDFGQTLSCTKAIYEAYKLGLITDTTMVANGKAFEEAVDIIRNDPDFANHIGVHLILTEDEPLTEGIASCPRLVSDGKFTKYFTSRSSNFKFLSSKEKKAIYDELSAQVDKLKDAGIILSHADSHHHVHTNFSICNIVFKVCKKNNIRRIRKRKNVLKYAFPKRAMYSFFNLLVKLNGFITSNYLGDIDDYENVKIPINSSVEVVVHPDYDKYGILIDRAPKKYNSDGSYEVIGKKLIKFCK